VASAQQCPADSSSALALASTAALAPASSSRLSLAAQEAPHQLQALAGGAGAACSENCFRDVRAQFFEYTIDLVRTQVVEVAVDDALVPRASLTLPSGSFRVASGVPLMQMRPVADSQMRDVANPVDETRRDEFGDALPLRRTVLSPAFECIVSPGVEQPFAVPLVYRAALDLNLGIQSEDVCLARAVGGRWSCLRESVADRAAHPAVLSSGPVGEGEDSINACVDGEIFAFIQAPLRKEVPENRVSDWIKENWHIVLIIIICTAVFFAGVFYWGARLYRYRRKYKEEKAKVEKMQEKVQDMELFGTAAHQDPDVDMVRNPLAVGAKDATGRFEAGVGGPADESDAAAERRERRQQELRERQAERDRLDEELARMRAELEFRKRAASGADAFAQGSGGGAHVAPPPQPATGVSPAPRHEQPESTFGAVRPKRKADVG
jgi:hypothetical protein